jgi:hypothetical protein
MDDWTFTVKYRWHDQTGAHFYQDLFSRSEATNFRGRDKEMGPLTSQTIKLAASYEILSNGWRFIDRASVNFLHRFTERGLSRLSRPQGGRVGR